MTQIAIPFTILIQGQGGHGSRPDQSHNPIDCFLGIHSALKAFPSVDPCLPCSCMFHTVGSDSRRGNIIPDTFTATGTFYCLCEEDGAAFRGRLNDICQSLAARWLCSATALF